jgi:uncharacterized membrane protein YhfC
MARPVGILILFLVTCSACGEVLFRESGEFEDGQDLVFTATVEVPPMPVNVGVLAHGSDGVRLTLRDASGWEIPATPLSTKPYYITLGNPQSPVEVIVEGAPRGKWQVSMAEVPDASLLYPMLATGPLMMLVAMAAVLWWRRKTGALWRWFWAGAGIWGVGVALKVAWAIPLNGPIIKALDAALPRSGYLAAGSVYIGALTGVFEIGITLAAALIWRRMVMTPAAAIAVGIGAGAVEALFLGLAGFVNIAVAASGAPGTEMVVVAAVLSIGPTSGAWLVGPIERILAIACHTGSRALTLLTVAGGKWRYFWYGFLIMTVIDSVAGYAHLANLIGTISLWWIELAILPAALVSVWAARWCYHHWPPAPVTPVVDAPMPAEEQLA